MIRRPQVSIRSAWVAACVGAVAVAGCSGSPEAMEAADNLPDLSVQGLTRMECGASSVWGSELEPASRPYVQECWKGSPELPFDQEAEDIMYTIMAATDARDVSDLVCPEDAFYDTAAVACRAALDGEVLYRTVVALTDPGSVVGALPDEPTEAEIDAALKGADVEVLVATEPAPEPS